MKEEEEIKKAMVALLDWYFEEESKGSYTSLEFLDEENKDLTMAEIIVRDYFNKED